MKIAVRILVALVGLIALLLTLGYMASGGPSEIVSRVNIKKSPEVVFDYISDMRNELKWNPDVQYMTMIGDGTVGVGTRFRAKWHMSDTLEVTLAQFQRPQVVRFENGGPIEVKLSVTLSPVGSGTELISRFVATPHGFVRAMFPLIKRQLQAQEKENMENLKKAIEALHEAPGKGT